MFLYIIYSGESMNTVKNHIDTILERNTDGTFVEKEGFKKARSSAEGILSANGMADDTKIEIVQLAMKYGFVVATADLPEETQGIISYDESGNQKQLGTKYSKLIVVNNQLSTEQKRFVVAHELGHYIMNNHLQSSGTHVEARTSNSNNHGGRPETENQIDYFAACLLMPRRAVLSEIEKYSKNHTLDDSAKLELAERLGSIFKVSGPVAYRRIEEVQALRNEDE